MLGQQDCLFCLHECCNAMETFEYIKQLNSQQICELECLNAYNIKLVLLTTMENQANRAKMGIRRNLPQEQRLKEINAAPATLPG